MPNVAVILFSLVIASASLAQSTGSASTALPATAESVLSSVQQYYANTKQLTAQFRQTVTNATFGTEKHSDGKLWVAKPAMFRWDYLHKNPRPTVTKSFIFDGQTFWLIDHSNKQIVKSQVASNTLPAAVSFLTGTGNLSSQFNIALNTTSPHALKNSIVLELTPKQASAQYSKLFFVVDQSDGHVKESIVIDAKGDTNMFQFFSPDLTTPIKGQWFNVNPSSLSGYSLTVTGAPSGATSAASRGSASGSGSASHP